MYGARIAGSTHRDRSAVVEYLHEENRVLRTLLGHKRPRLNDDQRRRLAAKDKALGRKLLATCCCIVTPDTILRWHRKLIAQKYDCSANRGPRRPRTAGRIGSLAVRMASRRWDVIVCIVYPCACGHEEIAALEFDSSAPRIRLDLDGLPVMLPLEALSSVASRLRNLASSAMPERGSPETG